MMFEASCIIVIHWKCLMVENTHVALIDFVFTLWRSSFGIISVNIFLLLLNLDLIILVLCVTLYWHYFENHEKVFDLHPLRPYNHSQQKWFLTSTIITHKFPELLISYYQVTVVSCNRTTHFTALVNWRFKCRKHFIINVPMWTVLWTIIFWIKRKLLKAGFATFVLEKLQECFARI